MAVEISRFDYAGMYGPTVGDKVRLADTELFIEVEKDLTTYGEEVKFGGGKVIRDGMGQSQVTRADGAPDTVITNALILDLISAIVNPTSCLPLSFCARPSKRRMFSKMSGRRNHSFGELKSNLH